MSSKHRDYYEVLGVTKEAAKEDIRKAYKKQALVWHPDRNLDNVEEATHRFKEVQDAYETLYDDNERAWYDEHKHIIMKGGMAAAKSGSFDDDADREPEQQNLWEFLSSSCYTTFNSKDKNNFFQVYQKVFDTILKEDEEYKSSKKVGGASSSTNVTGPSFGDEDTPFEQVNSFYTFWSNYSTKRSFAWKDKWRASDAENRFIRRQIEKENETERTKARKAHNELVKHLLKKVRTEDPRVKAEMKRKKKLLEEEEKRKQAEKELQEKLKREYLAEKEKLRQQLISGEFDEDEEISDDEEFNQVQDALDEVEDALDSYFNTEKPTKKSNKKVEQEVKEENQPEQSEQPTEEEDGESIDQSVENGDNNEEEEDKKKKKKDKKKQKKQKKGVVHIDQEQLLEVLREERERLEKAKTKQSKAKKKGNKKTYSDDEEEVSVKSSNKGNKKPTPQATKSTSTKQNKASASSTETKDVKSTEPKTQDEEEELVIETEAPTVGESQPTTTAGQQDEEEEEFASTAQGKKKKRRNKDKKKEKEQQSLSCNVCGESFPTRNSLFDHIKTEGHALHK